MKTKDIIKNINEGNPIKPVSFINGEDEYTTDINNLFTLPYKTVVTDSITQAMIYDKKKIRNLENTDVLDIDGSCINADYHHAFYTSIKAYMKMNITNLINDALFRFMNYMFRNSIAEVEINQFIACGYKAGLHNIDVNQIVNDAVDNSMCMHDLVRLDHSALICSLISVNDCIVSYIVNGILNPFINNLITTAPEGIEGLYRIIFLEVYGKDVDKEKSPDINLMYNFCTSCMRDTMEVIYNELLGSFQLITLTVANMFQGYSEYFDKRNLTNPDYDIDSLIKNNPSILEHTEVREEFVDTVKNIDFSQN